MGSIFKDKQQTVPAKKRAGTRLQRRIARKKQRRRTLKTIFTGVLMFTFLISGGLLLHDMYRSAQERKANEALLRRVEDQSMSADNAENALSGEGRPRNYRPLVSENADLAAWLIIDGIDVDYPVMYTPDDPEYYLRKAFNGSSALSGSLFIGANCIPDGTNIIIYGHNMNNGSMFGSLDSYADEDYAREHQEIIYDLIQPDGSYERLTFAVMAAFYSRVYTVEEQNVFRYYYGTDLSDPAAFQNYIAEVMAASLYDLGVTAEYGDRLLTLSTCSYHTEDGRFVVVAREEHSSTSTQ